MAHKLEPFKDQIGLFKANGESVRSIASKLSEMSGVKIAPSSVHHFLKGNGNGESKESPAVNPAPTVERVDNLQVRLDELKAQLDRIEGKIGLVWEDRGNGARVLRDRESGRGLCMQMEIRRADWYDPLLGVLFWTQEKCIDLWNWCRRA